MNSKYPLSFEQQEIVWADFQPSTENELRGRHPAVVLSTKGYSLITGLVAVSPITHATNNHFKSLFVPIEQNSKITGFVNPLQFHTFRIKGRHIESAGSHLDDHTFAQVIRIHRQLLNLA